MADESYRVGAREAWLRISLVEGAVPVHTMVVTRARRKGDLLYLSGDDPNFSVELPWDGQDLQGWLGCTVLYRPVSNDTGRFIAVEEPL